MTPQIRPPAVAGQFYPGRAEVLLHDIREYTTTNAAKRPALGCVVPHAGYMYSGRIAGAVYASLQLPKRYVILCPNHTGVGAPLAINSIGAWETPLGEIPVDSELAEILKGAFPLLAEDRLAHRAEHALEVQLPFLQTLVKTFQFVPITVGTSRLDVLQQLGQAICESLRKLPEPAMVIASSDMNHYESDSITRVKDHKAIDRILAVDPEGLYETIQREHITMCGYGPAVAMLTAAKSLGAIRAELVRYATSGDISGDKDWVVGYAGITVH